MTRSSQTGPTLSGVRAAVLSRAASLAVACTGAASRARRAPGGMRARSAGSGPWVDVYDGGVYAAPERTAQRIADRGVDVVWAETANYGAATDVVKPAQLGRLVDALHARGVRVVAWYLPGHVDPARGRSAARSRCCASGLRPAGSSTGSP